MQSIDDQISRLNKLAADFGLTVKEVLTEAHSAKAPGERPVFNRMLSRIEKGEANGILCWQINRLSRNPVDSAKVQWLLQQGIIRSIQTIDGERKPEDNALLFSVEAGVSNQYIIDLRKNIKRGLESKLAKGWLPCLPPAGYLNEPVERTIVRDTARFDLVKKMWRLMTTGCYNPSQILKMATEEWGYRTRKTRKCGNKPLSMSGIYRIFTNPFYCGIMEYGGRRYIGKHEPMVTTDEYEKVQALLGRRGKPQPQKHVHAFTGVIRCGECGCMITAEKKFKFIKRDKTLKSFTYYRCTKHKRSINCSQHTRITLAELESQIEAELAQYEIIPELKDEALKFLDRQSANERNESAKITETRRRSLAEAEKQLENLTRLCYRDLINDDEFIRERDKLRETILQLQLKLREGEDEPAKYDELTKAAFAFAAHAREAFVSGDDETKKGIFVTFGLNPTLKDGKLNVQAAEWLQRIQKEYKLLAEEYLRFEPPKTRINTDWNALFELFSLRWWRTVKAVRTKIKKSNTLRIMDLESKG